MSELVDAFWHAPPFARTLTAAIVLTTICTRVLGFGGNWVMLDGLHRIFKLPPEIWRFATAFFIAGPKLEMIMDPYFAYQNLRELEMANPKFSKKEDLLWYLITVGGFTITILRILFGHWRGVYLQGLIIAMCYTGVQDKRGQKAGFFFFQVPAQSLPYCMLIWTLVTEYGDLPLQISGILAAHLHDFLTRLWPEFGMGPNLLPTPAFISKLVQTPRFMKRDYGAAVRPKDRTSESSAGASTGSVLPDEWKTRGAGHRLG